MIVYAATCPWTGAAAARTVRLATVCVRRAIERRTLWMAEDAARELPLGVSASGGASRNCGVSGTAPCDGVRPESHDFVAAATEGAQIIEQSLLRASSVADRDGSAARANLVIRAHLYKTRAARKTCAKRPALRTHENQRYVK